MSKTKIITISREYGSGGRIIGEKVAKELGISFYDKVLIDIVAKQSGMDEKFLEEATDTMIATEAFNLSAFGYYTAMANIGSDLFSEQSKAIEMIAEKEPCVIVGRCADYVLRNRDDVLNVFIHAQDEDRIKRAIEDYKIAEKDAKNVIKKSDKARAKHYKYYCEKMWGHVENYHLSIDSSKFSLDDAVNVICNAAKL